MERAAPNKARKRRPGALFAAGRVPRTSACEQADPVEWPLRVLRGRSVFVISVVAGMTRLVTVSVVAALLIGCSSNPPAPSTDSAPAEPSIDVVELSVADARDRMAAGTLTSRALTQAYLDRIAKIDDAGPRLNAVIELNPNVLTDAEALDDERRAGRIRGPLHGIPVLLKDNIDVAGMVNSAGSLALAEHRPQRDAFHRAAPARLRAP